MACDLNKAVRERCMQCVKCEKNALGEWDCPIHLVPVVGLYCFKQRTTPVYSPPAAPAIGAEGKKPEKEQVFRVKIRRIKDVPPAGLREIDEVCPHCERENSFLWDTASEGFMAYCPGCGERLMLCGECFDSGENCDYNDYSDYCHMMCRSSAGKAGKK